MRVTLQVVISTTRAGGDAVAKAFRTTGSSPRVCIGRAIDAWRKNHPYARMRTGFIHFKEVERA
jgi:hypothetical protein